ncbi:helix-turn-helix domain-containing protein [Sporomusa acidovorans]|uniref:Helix-turn-helix domain-containing protein n=1 Tax=Sporomusa acidovorans (strain ATCC 49682 / DSM 3132 / Mol) TaxID=1123286 RepID=A0ABZ3IWZ0_SPOA4|nr:helix-turn-helix domain-containing protein [Sporomusa acidovorans]OZC23650.1 helix-turn-helix domain protein [Sporomusa acidovorans DSM 3132]SDE23943.1 DNA binding domain-containing protein, excisionase family [Sporomusa acidovorans]
MNSQSQKEVFIITIYTLKQENGTNKKYTVKNGELVELQENEPVTRITVTPEEGRKMLGLARNTFMRLLYTGQIRAKKAGKRWLIPVEAIREFLERT